MSDYEAIQQLMARYAYAIDGRDYDGIALCFTSDATAIYAGHSRVLKGHGEIIDHMKLALGSSDVTQHCFMNFLVEMVDGSAYVRCDVLGRHVTKHEQLQAGGKYEVTARREAGAWKIAQLSARAVWKEGSSAMLPKA